MPLIDREQEVSSKPAPAAAPVEAAPEVPDVEVAPPKPPLPEAKMAELRWGWKRSSCGCDIADCLCLSEQGYSINTSPSWADVAEAFAVAIKSVETKGFPVALFLSGSFEAVRSEVTETILWPFVPSPQSIYSLQLFQCNFSLFSSCFTSNK